MIAKTSRLAGYGVFWLLMALIRPFRELASSCQSRLPTKDRSRFPHIVLLAAALFMLLGLVLPDAQAQSVSWRLQECSGRRRITAVVVGRADATTDFTDHRVAQDLIAEGKAYALQTCRKLKSWHIQKFIQVFLDTPQAPRGWWQWPPVRGYYAWGNRFHYVNTIASEHKKSAITDHGGSTATDLPRHTLPPVARGSVLACRQQKSQSMKLGVG